MTKGVMNAYVELEVRDKNGKVVSRRRFRAKSFVANFLRILRRIWLTTGTISGGSTCYLGFSTAEPVDTGSNARAVLAGAHTTTATQINRCVSKMDAGVGDVNSGIRVGTGSSAPAPTQVVLDTAIAEGVGGGQMSHGAVTIDAISIVGAVTTLRIIRVMTNSSGGAITVNEVGLFVYAQYAYGSDASFMIARDLVAGGISVPNGSSLTVRYILTTTT